jgi:sigma-B regulation protein RsbU (phosphoserine phosphatase)
MTVQTQTQARTLPRLLIADDQPDVLEALRLLLLDDYEADFVTSTAAVLECVQARAYDLLLIDLNYARDTTSGREGLELLSRVREMDGSLPVVVMTGWGTIDTAVEAMRRGARSFVQKPWEDTTLLEILQREIEEARAAKRRDATQQREEEEARLIQRGLLPPKFPDVPGFGLAGGWRPASGVGGDCYDVLAFDGNQIGLSIADVCGKGLPAALLMSNLQAAVRAFAQDTSRPHTVCASVNRLLCRNMISGRFVTFCYVRLDVPTRQLSYAIAGHNPPILLRRNGEVLRLATGGTVLGVFPETAYAEDMVQLETGDTLVLFTDGITEARNEAGDEYEDDRLIDAIRQYRGLPAARMQQKLFDDVLQFANGELQDDATLIVLKVESDH